MVAKVASLLHNRPRSAPSATDRAGYAAELVQDATEPDGSARRRNSLVEISGNSAKVSATILIIASIVLIFFSTQFYYIFLRFFKNPCRSSNGYLMDLFDFPQPQVDLFEIERFRIEIFSGPFKIFIVFRMFWISNCFQKFFISPYAAHIFGWANSLTFQE